MIDRLTFLNDAWSWPIIIGMVVLLLVFVWKELHHFPSTRFYLKVGVVFLGICSLAMIALKPALFNSERSGNLILLTENYRPFSLDSLKKKDKKIKVLRYDKDASIIMDVESADTIFVLGNGIRTYDRWQLEGKATKYIGGEQLTGITRFNYQQNHVVGDKAVFKGLYLQPTQDNRLLLQGPGGQVLDSLNLLEGKEQQFELSTDLKSSGNFVFSLVEKDSLGELKSSYPIPLIVSKKEALKILMINGFPTFESKYLKNFLTEMNHEVIVRSQISKGKYKYEAFNTEKTALGNISENFLNNYDLLIIDFNSFKTLSTSENNAVEKSIREYGLGVFIQPDPTLFRAKSGLASFNFTQDNIEEATLNETLELTKYPFYFKQELALQPILTNGKQILSAYKRMGQGKVGSSVLQNTYELLLEGHSLAYQQLWTKHINSISKRAIPFAEWLSDSKIGAPDEPFQFQLRTLEEAPIVLNEEGSIIPLRRAIDIPSLWTGITYPKRTGWQQLRLQQDSTNVFDYYVVEPENWNALKAYQQIQENQQNVSSGASSRSNYKKAIPINLLYFYLAFLFSVGYLWLEPKIRSY